MSSPEIRLYNQSRQTIPVHVKPEGGDFFLHEQVVYIQPGKSVVVPTSIINNSQIGNLQAKGMLKILHDSREAD
jgi:hypothetical protein